MQIYDISQEVFSSVVYPGDKSPEAFHPLSIDRGDVVNLTEFFMCAHNGTHVDAPYHFIRDGKTVDALSLDVLVGPCTVVSAVGEVTAEMAEGMVDFALTLGQDYARRILIKGDCFVSLGASEVFVRRGVLLVGNESQTVGPEKAPAAVHNVLLGHDVILLEGIRLSSVPDGGYLLNAVPLNLGGCDGAPCRAILIGNA